MTLGKSEVQVRFNIIRKLGDKYILYSRKTGKRLGTHPSKAAALRQERAIEASKHGR